MAEEEEKIRLIPRIREFSPEEKAILGQSRDRVIRLLLQGRDLYLAKEKANQVEPHLFMNWLRRRFG